MDFLGVGPLELIFIIIIALVVIGPRDLSKAARSIGRYLNKLYKSETWHIVTETSRTLRNLPNRLAREAALEELDQTRQTIVETGQGVAEDMRSIDEDIQAWDAQPPNHGPPPVESDPLSEKPVDPKEG